MGTSVRSASLQDRSDLVRFGNSCIDLLMLDYLWTLAVETKDPEAAGIGRRMLALIGTMRHEGGRASELVRSSRVELNSTWPQIREQHRLPQEQMAAIDGFIKEYGGLGDAGFSVAQELDNTLGAEASAIAGKIADFEDRARRWLGRGYESAWQNHARRLWNLRICCRRIPNCNWSLAINSRWRRSCLNLV